jgi:hypothetical protein
MLMAMDTTSKGLITLLVSLVIMALVFWLIWWVIDWMKLPAPVNLVARVVIGLIAILMLLHLLGLY